jgi:hypothetical protein
VVVCVIFLPAADERLVAWPSTGLGGALLGREDIGGPWVNFSLVANVDPKPPPDSGVGAGELTVEKMSHLLLLSDVEEALISLSEV